MIMQQSCDLLRLRKSSTRRGADEWNSLRLQSTKVCNPTLTAKNSVPKLSKLTSKLHEQKSALERELQTKTRKRKAIDTKPLEEPLKIWDSLTVQEKHSIAVMMIEVVYVSAENGVEVVFCI